MKFCGCSLQLIGLSAAQSGYAFEPGSLGDQTQVVEGIDCSPEVEAPELEFEYPDSGFEIGPEVAAPQ